MLIQKSALSNDFQRRDCKRLHLYFVATFFKQPAVFAAIVHATCYTTDLSAMSTLPKSQPHQQGIQPSWPHAARKNNRGLYPANEYRPRTGAKALAKYSALRQCATVMAIASHQGTYLPAEHSPSGRSCCRRSYPLHHCQNPSGQSADTSAA